MDPTLVLTHDYEKKLQNSTPTFFKEKVVKPPPGALGAIHTVPALTVPPINTNINFDTLTPFKVSEHRGLAAISTPVPLNFNWHKDAKKKDKEGLIVTPGNQMLCGSCWAIASAGVISDNFVVSGLVDWFPNLSTSWILTCYPQNKCQGGNPSTAFTQISQGGLVSNHCIDYSWCGTNDLCNGTATKHFDEKTTNLSLLVPPKCGCYEESDFYYYQIKENSKLISLGVGGVTVSNMGHMIKNHILLNGPVLGGFIVFENFMNGTWTKINGGVYLENAVYKDGKVSFDPLQSTAVHYKGSHAVAVIGWGIQPDVIVDNKQTKKDIPYWYCRNSWTEKWGDGGYFKMAMYPYNKVSQFDKTVKLYTLSGLIQAGGMIMIEPLSSPKKKHLPVLAKNLKDKRLEDPSYYMSDPKTKHSPGGPPGGPPSGPPGGPQQGKRWSTLEIIVVIIVVVMVVGLLAYLCYKYMIVPRSYLHTTSDMHYPSPSF